MTLLGSRPEQDTAMAPSTRPGQSLGRWATALLVAGMVSLLLAITSLWTWRTFADSQGFADVATDMLRDPDVRQLLAEQITDQLERQSATSRATVTLRPVLEGAVEAIVATSAFQGLYHASVRELHAAITQGHKSRLVVDVNDTAPLVRSSLQKLNPTLASSIPDEAIDVQVGFNNSSPVDTALRVAALSGWLAWGFAFAALGSLVAAIAVARDHRRAVEVLGLCLLGLGVVIVVVLHIGGGIASRSGDDELQGHVLRAAFWSITNLLSIQATIAMTAGAVLALAGAYAGNGRLHERALATWQAGWHRLERPGWKATASLALIGVAVVAMVWPAAVAAVIVRIAAFGAFVAGAVGLLDLLGSRRWVLPGGTALSHSHRRLAVSLVAALGAVAALVFFGGLRFVNGLRAPAARSTSIAFTGCNQQPVLCDRRLDEVVFAGTHNAMAATADDFTFARQSGGVLAQLGSGVRAFLLDLIYGSEQEPSTMVRTALDADPAALAEADLSDDELTYARSFLSALGSPPPAEREVYLCHVYCELGGTPAEKTFRRMADWLRENPNEVLVLVLEDHVAPADAIEALERSGLADRAYALDPDGPFPTLRQMIDARRNVVIMAEHSGGGDLYPWYHDAYGQLLEETPYDFDTAAEMSCGPNRGGNGKRLLLVNHWINEGDPEDAATVNSLDRLVGRAERCKRARDHTPNILAVDFYERGDVMDAVDELNHVGLANSSLTAAGAALQD